MNIIYMQMIRNKIISINDKILKNWKAKSYNSFR
jgi:hypothetical protein